MKRVALLFSILALLVSAAPALADGGSSCSTYSSLCSVVSNTSPSHSNSSSNASADVPANANASTTTAQSALPFTGLDVVLLAAGGGTLLGAGLIVRRLSRGVS